MKAEYIETPIEIEDKNEVDIVLGKGDVTVFGSNTISEAEKVDKGDVVSKESIEEQVNEFQSKKIGASVMDLVLGRGLKKQEAELMIQSVDAKFGARLAYLNSLSDAKLNAKRKAA